MAKSNSEVAEAFAKGGRPCKGSNTDYSRTVMLFNGKDGNELRKFTSYSTVVAVIRDDILWWMDYRSSSTQRQLQYVRRAWYEAKGENAKSMCVPDPAGGASHTNVLYYVRMGEEALQSLLKPRIRDTTKVKHWGEFLSWVERTDHLLTLPCYSLPLGELVRERLETLRRIRDSNDANPVGLGTVITNVRAIHALEGN